MFQAFLHAEQMLQSLQRDLITFGHFDAFNILDRDRDSIVTKKDVAWFLKLHFGQAPTKAEIRNLFH